MVVKIPVRIQGAKTASEKEIIESPGTKTTQITNEKETPCHYAAPDAADEAPVGDNSSISSRSSINSMPNYDHGARSRIKGVNSTAYLTAAKAAAATSDGYAVTISSLSDHSREQIDHHYTSPDSLLLDEHLANQTLNTPRSLSFTLPPKNSSSPSPSTNSFDWQFSGNIEHFFEENDRAVGLSPAVDTEKMSIDACPLEQCQLESFDTDDKKLLLRETSNAGGSGTSNATHKMTNKSPGRMPMPSPSGCSVSLPTNSSHIESTPLAPPSIGDIFSPDYKGNTHILPAKKRGGTALNIFDSTYESSPSKFFMTIPAANSFSDLLTTPQPSSEEYSEIVLPITSQVKGTQNAKEEEKKKERFCSDKPNYKDIMHKLKDTSELDLQLPSPLGSDCNGGHRRFIINGPLKTCASYSIDHISANGTHEFFYQFLQTLSPAFEGCAFLLPWLRASETKAKVNVSLMGSFRLSQGALIRPMTTGPSVEDLATAKRRIQSAICAFGGSINSKMENEGEDAEKLDTITQNKSKSSIFRKKCSDASRSSLSSSLKETGLKRKRKSLRREKYEEMLRDQYFEHGNRLSWDVQHSLKLTLSGAKTFDEEDNSDSSSNKQNSDKMDKEPESSRPTKYKCTYCGTLKKKHVCTNRPTILRNIGVNVYPAVNSYTADEPGSLTFALSEMNNFIPLSNSDVCHFISEEVGRKKAALPAQAKSLPPKFPMLMTTPYLRTSLLPNPPKRHQKSYRDKEAESRRNPLNLIFQPSMEITHDQYLKVKTLPTDRDYIYPAVPLTFRQRKSISDALLSMTKSVPQLTHACAIVLKDARKKNQWDQAVAELMSQVLCILKCSLSKDFSLEGLRLYLLELGISC